MDSKLKRLGKFFLKLPFFSLSSILLVALGIVFLPIMAPGLIYRWRHEKRREKMIRGENLRFSKMVLSFNPPLSLFPYVLFVQIFFVIPCLLWLDAIDDLREGLWSKSKPAAEEALPYFLK